MNRATYHATRRQLHDTTMRAVAHWATKGSPGWSYADEQAQKRFAEDIAALRLAITPRVDWVEHCREQRRAAINRRLAEHVRTVRHKRAAQRQFAAFKALNPDASSFALAWVASNLGVAP